MPRQISAAALIVCLGFTVAARATTPLELADQAYQQLRDQDWPGAATTYAAIVKANPYHAVHWHYYGYALFQTQRYDDAIGAWEKTAELGFAADKRWAEGRTMLTLKDGRL